MKFRQAINKFCQDHSDEQCAAVIGYTARAVFNWRAGITKPSAAKQRLILAALERHSQAVLELEARGAR